MNKEYPWLDEFRIHQNTPLHTVDKKMAVHETKLGIKWVTVLLIQSWKLLKVLTFPRSLFNMHLKEMSNPALLLFLRAGYAVAAVCGSCKEDKGVHDFA